MNGKGTCVELLPAAAASLVVSVEDSVRRKRGAAVLKYVIEMVENGQDLDKDMLFEIKQRSCGEVKEAVEEIKV